MPNIALDNLLLRYPILTPCKEQIWKAYELLLTAFKNNRVLYTCGNGGSCADSDHIVGEILKGFTLKRPIPKADKQAFLANHCEGGSLLAEKLQCGFRALNLMSQSAIYTAVGNDLGGDMGPAQQLYAFGRQGDILLGLSTSGNAQNLYLACQVAKVKNISIIGMTGCQGGRLAEMADVCIRVPEKETYKVQELHLPVYHALCIMIEKSFFTE